MAEKLEGAERLAALQPLFDRGWELVEGRDAIRKEFKFKRFPDAFGWMARIALSAERLDHHPEWSNVYNRVAVVLTTHRAKGLTLLDVKLAREMEQAYDSFRI